jgi:hypothetical protein
MLGTRIIPPKAAAAAAVFASAPEIRAPPYTVAAVRSGVSMRFQPC